MLRGMGSGWAERRDRAENLHDRPRARQNRGLPTHCWRQMPRSSSGRNLTGPALLGSADAEVRAKATATILRRSIMVPSPLDRTHPLRLGTQEPWRRFLHTLSKDRDGARALRRPLKRQRRKLRAPNDYALDRATSTSRFPRSTTSPCWFQTRLSAAALSSRASAFIRSGLIRPIASCVGSLGSSGHRIGLGPPPRRLPVLDKNRTNRFLSWLMRVGHHKSSALG
jgi:hypothetical protein